MTRSHSFPIFLGSCVILLLGACVHKPVKPDAEPAPMAQMAPPPPQTVLLQEARSEAEQLRAELASLKILMAKQSGELRTLQEQGQGVQKREQERGMEIQNIRSELMASQSERDQLHRRNMELEGQIGGLANTNQLVTEIQTLRTSFQQMMANLKTLSSDLTLIKKAMHVTTNSPKAQQTALPHQALSPSAPSGADHPNSHGQVVIQEGDTLWKLANRYHVSIDQLKDWNHLSSDLIMTGLRLRVVAPDTTQEALSSPDPKLTNVEAPVQAEAKAAPLKNHTPDQQLTTTPGQTETKNLLSVSTPK